MDTYTIDRFKAQTKRSNLLDGAWQGMLDEHLSKILDSQRQSAIGAASTALNLFESVVRKLSVLYDKNPTVFHADMNDAQLKAFNELPLWEQAQKHSLSVVGIGESLIKIGWDKGNHAGGGGLTISLVQPQNVIIKTLPSAPLIPVEIAEKSIRVIDKIQIQCLDIWNIEDPNNPYFKVLSFDRKKDFTEKLGLNNDYPYVDSEGPFLPWVLYHLEATGQLFDYRHFDSLVVGTLDVGSLVSYFLHGVADASWSQKVAIDLSLGSATSVNIGGKPTDRISTDPTSVLMFSSGQDKSGSIQTLSPAVDSMGSILSIESYIKMILSSMGMETAEVSGTQSGVAITLRRETIKGAQARYKPGFKAGDTEYISKATRMHNIYSSEVELPTSEYKIKYEGIPLNHAELIERTDIQKRDLDSGLTSKVHIIAENKEITLEEAVAFLEEVARYRHL